MPVQLPIQPSVPNYRMQTTLNGNPYIFDVLWNATDSAWYFDLYEADETQIAVGVKVVLGCFLFSRVIHPLFQSGVLFATDTSRQQLDAGFDDFGTRVQVQYYLNSEVVTFK